ncbi:MAG: hypothetical protein V4478_00725 [Patescibacteria group bacterium]
MKKYLFVAAILLLISGTFTGCACYGYNSNAHGYEMWPQNNGQYYYPYATQAAAAAGLGGGYYPSPRY